MTDTEEGADIIVLKTCAIREHAEQRVFGNVGALTHTKKRHPRQKIFLCGCMMGQEHVSNRIKHSYHHVDGVFNPHHLALDRVYYALLDPDRGVYEPFRILRLVDDQTLKVDRILEMSFKNYFPVTPEVRGKTGPDGSYCLRLRDEGQDARWVIRWTVNGENRFRMVNFREGVPLPLEEGGG